MDNVTIKRTRDIEIALFDLWYADMGGEDYLPIESPIEKIFWMNLMKVKFGDFPHCYNEVNLVAAGWQCLKNKETGKSFFLSDGYPKEYYVIDFLINYCDFRRPRNWATVAVELDGHDFHEKTKVQAKRDKEKDRWLQSQGLIVARFTGSEIYNDPEEAVNQVQRMAYGRLRALARSIV